MQGSNQTNFDSTPSIDYWQILKNRYGVILLTFLLVFITAAVITSVIPEKYESTSVVQVHPSTIAITPFRGQSAVNPGSQMTAQYLQNEFESIIAPETLAMAAEKAQLPVQWGMDMDDVVSLLEGIVETIPRRGTDFIEINVRHASASDAKNIAESVAEAYIVRRRKIEEDRAKKALDALDAESTEQEDLVDDYRKDLTVLIQQYGIPYFDGGSAGNRLGLSEQAMFQSAKGKLANFETQADQIKIQIGKLVQLTSEELISYAAGLDLPQNQVTAYALQNRSAVDRMLDLEAKGLGKNTPIWLQ